MKKQHKRILIGSIVLIVAALAAWGIYTMSTDRQTDDRITIPSSYTMADVAAARTTLKCWAAIDGSVYDLTSYASENSSLLALCGTDASETVAQLPNVNTESFKGLRIGSLNS